MTDRDTFAAAALTGLLVAMQSEEMAEAPQRAYQLADAMLAERAKSGAADDTSAERVASQPYLEHDGNPVDTDTSGGQVLPKENVTPRSRSEHRLHEELCSEDGRVRASASSIGTTQEVLIGGWRGGKPLTDVPVVVDGSTRNGALSGCQAVRSAPQSTLTDAEREAVERAVSVLGDHPFEEDNDRAAALRGLLERTGRSL